MLSSLSIVQKMAIVFLFVALFAHLQMGLIDAFTLITMNMLGMLVLACAGSPARMGGTSSSIRSMVRAITSLIVLIFVLQALSPVVRTFSKTTSDGSVWACAAILLGGHLAFADYSMCLDPRARLISTISLNMAMCASVVLSSRLALDVDVFALLFAALELFAIYPLLRDRVYLSYGAIITRDGWRIPRMVIPLTALFAGTSMYAMWPVSHAVAVLIEPGALLFVCVLCPLWMRRAQRWKTEMRGPWDEAVLYI